MAVRLNPAVRLIPPSDVSGDSWLAENLLERKRYKISRRAAAALVAANRAQEPDELAQRLTELSGADSWEPLIGSLRARSLIIDAADATEDPELAWMTRLRQNWSRFGWHEAAEYHLLCHDYPCVDYSEAVAVQMDQDRMRGYQATEPDNDRFKLEYLDRPATPLPEPTAQMPTATAGDVWADTPLPGLADAETLSTVISLAFGEIGTLVPRTNSAPLLRRSSPSGGGRNPSEGYVIVRDVPGMDQGWYHITMKPFGLRLLDGPKLSETVVWEHFPETAERFPFAIRALVVVTSFFERNMYRYREPRTFRTVHMDAGHIAGSLRLAARSLGLTAGIYYCDHATQIEQSIGLDGMKEGYMLTVAIADGQETGKAQS